MTELYAIIGVVLYIIIGVAVLAIIDARWSNALTGPYGEQDPVLKLLVIAAWPMGIVLAVLAVACFLLNFWYELIYKIVHK